MDAAEAVEVAEVAEVVDAAEAVDDAAESVDAADALLLVLEQTTLSGRSVTPEMAQKSCANLVAFAWSSALHFPARQHAVSLRKVELEQMHLMSVPEQPPILLPVVNWVTQVC